jgi:hypothetical protein
MNPIFIGEDEADISKLLVYGRLWSAVTMK